MTQRQLAPLCFILALSCTTAQPQKPAAPVEAPKGAQEIDVEVVRGAFDAAYPEWAEAAPWVAQRVELDGASPREVLMYKKRGDEERFWVYDMRDAANPRWVAAPYPDKQELERRQVNKLLGADTADGWWRAEDLDADGKDELIIAGPSSRVMPTPLAVLGWGESGGLEDRLWRYIGGDDVVIADVDGDGRSEIVVLYGADEELGEPARMAALQPNERGWWRPVATLDLKAALPRVLDAIVKGTRHPRPQQVLPPVIALMKLHKVAPRDVPALHAQLASMVKEGTQEDPSALYDAMAWEGNLAAYDVLLPLVIPLTDPQPVVEALLELDARNGQTRGRDALIGWLKATLPGVGPYEAHLIIGVLRGLERRGDGAGAALVAAALAEEARPLETREQLLDVALPYMSSQQAALWALRPLRPVLIERLVALAVASRAPDARWRAALDVAELKALMADPATRADGIRLALCRTPPLRAEAFASLAELADEELRIALLQDAARLDVAPPALAQLTRWLARAKGEERSLVLGWVMQSGDAALLLKLLEQQRDAQTLMVASRAVDVPACDASSPVCRPGALLKELPALHKIVAARVRSGDAKVREAALVVMARMPDEPTQRLLLEVARTHKDEATRKIAREAVLYARSPLSRGYLLEELAREPSDYNLLVAFGAAMEEADAQRLVDGLGDPATRDVSLWQLVFGAPRVCAPRLAELEALMADPTLACDAREQAARVLALCSPDWLLTLARDEGVQRCEGGELEAALAPMTLHGTAAHVAALEALSDEPGSRALRERAAEIVQVLRRRLARPAR
jgi:hypothetical protein